MDKPGSTLPATHRTAHVFVDESGTAGQSPVLAIGALRFQSGHGRLITKLQQFRDRADWRSECHFTDVKRLNVHRYREVIRIIAASDARFVCLVVDRQQDDPFAKRGAVPWKVHAQLTISVLNRTITGDEVVSATVDNLTVPSDVNYEGYIRSAVNRQRRRLAVATVCRMDSRACWGIQIADLLTGAVAHQYRQAHDPRVKAGTPKGALAAFVSEQFNLTTLVGASSHRLRVVEHRPNRGPRRRLEVVDDQRSIS